MGEVRYWVSTDFTGMGTAEFADFAVAELQEPSAALPSLNKICLLHETSDRDREGGTKGLKQKEQNAIQPL